MGPEDVDAASTASGRGPGPRSIHPSNRGSCPLAAVVSADRAAVPPAGRPGLSPPIGPVTVLLPSSWELFPFGGT